MNHRIPVITILTLGILLAIFSEQAFACSCGKMADRREAYESSDIIITAKLVSIEKRHVYDRDLVHSASFEVIESYKGGFKPRERLMLAQGGGADCVWMFSEQSIGNKYLFYLGEPIRSYPWYYDGEIKVAEELAYRAITCGRSRRLEYAGKDLRYLAKFVKRLKIKKASNKK